MVALVLVLVAGPSTRIARSPTPATLGPLHAPDNNPVIAPGGCTFVPDPSNPLSFPCGVDNSGTQFAYLGAPLALDLNVSSPDGAVINVTVRWDTALDFNGYPFKLQVLNASAVQYFDVSPSGPNVSVHIHTEWTYWVLSPNPVVSGSSSYYNVSVNASSASGSDPFKWDDCTTLLPYGNCFFKIAVAMNSPPTLSGLQMAYTFSLPPPDPVIPAFTATVSVQDADNDPVTVAWNWDDGNISVNRTAAAGVRTFFNATHTYVFPVNVTPRYWNFTVRVSVDDAVPTHNRTTEVLLSYYLAYDGMPTSLQFLSPHAGTQLQVGQTVPIEASLAEPEGETMTYYWDFGDGQVSEQRTVHNATGQSALVYANHTYASAGPVDITLWATDGTNKSLCLNPDSNCTDTLAHWAHLSLPISVILNRAPVVSLTIWSSPGVYGKEAGFAAAVWDADADNLTVTWNFGDQEYVGAKAWAVNRTAGATDTAQVTQAHNYTHWGYARYNYTFNVTVWVDDGHGHNVTNTTRIFVGSANQGPVVFASFLTNATVHANETFALNITVRDEEGNTVWINVSFGDNRFWEGNVTPEPAVNYSLTVEHAYRRPGNYTINVTVTDRMIGVWMNNGTMVFLPHNATAPLVIEVYPAPPPPVSTEWTWVDYTTLAAVLAIPVAIGVRSGYRRYQERRED